MKRRKVLITALLGLGLIVLLTALDYGLQKTRTGKWFASSTYVSMSSLVRALSGRLDTLRSPIVIIDTAAVGTLTDEAGDHYTSPKILLNIVNQVAARPGVQAIALDIDLSPVLTEHGFRPLPGFLDLMKRADELRKNGIPVFFGVDRTAGYGRAHWLFDEQWAKHAVWLRIPQRREYMIPLSFRSPAWAEGESLPSMAAALAGAVTAKDAESGDATKPGKHGFDGGVEIVGKDGFEVEMLLSDLGWIGAVKTNVVPCDAEGNVPVAMLSLEKMRGSVVIIGRATQALDQFLPPGFDDMVPGIFLHAAGAATLMNLPLNALPPSCGTGLSVSVMLFFWALNTALGYIRHKAGGADDVDGSLLRDISSAFFANLTWVVIALAIGAVLLLFFHIFWLELTTVLVFAALQTLAECWIAVRLRKGTNG